MKIKKQALLLSSKLVTHFKTYEIVFFLLLLKKSVCHSLCIFFFSQRTYSSENEGIGPPFLDCLCFFHQNLIQ
jgi:hypothetical protein